MKESPNDLYSQILKKLEEKESVNSIIDKNTDPIDTNILEELKESEDTSNTDDLDFNLDERKSEMIEEFLGKQDFYIENGNAEEQSDQKNSKKKKTKQRKKQTKGKETKGKETKEKETKQKQKRKKAKSNSKVQSKDARKTRKLLKLMIFIQIILLSILIYLLYVKIYDSNIEIPFIKPNIENGFELNEDILNQLENGEDSENDDSHQDKDIFVLKN